MRHRSSRDRPAANRPPWWPPFRETCADPSEWLIQRFVASSCRRIWMSPWRLLVMGFKLSSFGVAAGLAVKALPAHSYFSASRPGKRQRPEFQTVRGHANSLRHNVRVNAPSNHPLAESRLNHAVEREPARSVESSAALSDIWGIA